MLDDNGKKFVGFDNYTEIFTTQGTRLTVVNSVTWVIVGTIVTVIVGLAVARFADGMRGEKSAKSPIFIPGAISLVGAGIDLDVRLRRPAVRERPAQRRSPVRSPVCPTAWAATANGSGSLERGFGGARTHPASAPGFNTFLLIVIFIWAQAGFATVIFSAAIKGVPESLIEAAKVDGATDRQAFYKVTLPYIRATIITVATTTTIAGLKAFDIVAATTGGDFGTSTIANEFYVTDFVQGRNGSRVGARRADLRAGDPDRLI